MACRRRIWAQTRSFPSWPCRISSEFDFPRSRRRFGRAANSGQKKAHLGWRAESISEETWRRQDEL
ncbi:hypothetical protein F6X39_26775 [Paraburkholderia sp. UCT2]|nr:hypothetical protein [Paraburkholderia sp. UCT2]